MNIAVSFFAGTLKHFVLPYSLFVFGDGCFLLPITLTNIGFVSSRVSSDDGWTAGIATLSCLELLVDRSALVRLFCLSATVLLV